MNETMMQEHKIALYGDIIQDFVFAMLIIIIMRFNEFQTLLRILGLFWHYAQSGWNNHN